MRELTRQTMGHKDDYTSAQNCFGSAGLANVIGLITVFMLLGGCGDIQIRVGDRPDVSVLEGRLQLGQSREVDVLAALGEPFGRGREMLPISRMPRTMWTYYYEEGSLKDDRRIFLFIYFDHDRYDGYMWFSSLEK